MSKSKRPSPSAKALLTSVSGGSKRKRSGNATAGDGRRRSKIFKNKLRSPLLPVNVQTTTQESPDLHRRSRELMKPGGALKEFDDVRKCISSIERRRNENLYVEIARLRELHELFRFHPSSWGGVLQPRLARK